MRTLVLRFDIDTYRCLSEGVPNLLELARDEGVKFTFFSNMGRSVSRPALLKKALRGHKAAGTVRTAPKLPAAVKLGRSHLLHTLLVNPLVGASRPEILRRVLDEGHDLGLHGGTNHGAWQHGFRHWTARRIEQEIAAGKSIFERLLGQTPRLFSSPGWQGSDILNTVLATNGFMGSADRHGPDENEVECQEDFCTLPTNLVAEPGGVAYFESLAAQGFDSAGIASQFESTLAGERRIYVLYDHPCYAGVTALDAVRSVVRCAKKNGVEVTTMHTLAERELHRP